VNTPIFFDEIQDFMKEIQITIINVTFIVVSYLDATMKEREKKNYSNWRI